MPKNNNCLKGRACPSCGQEDRLDVSATSVFRLVDGGTENHGDVEFDNDSRAIASLSHHVHTASLPAAVWIPASTIAACERPFPLTEGNDAEEQIQLCRIAHELKGRNVDIFRDTIAGKVTITIK